MPFDPKQFAEDILKGVQVADAQKQTFLQVLSTPEVAKQVADLKEGYMRQSDYSRKQAEAQEALKKAQEWYDQLNVWKTNKEAELGRLEAELKAGGRGTAQDPLDTDLGDGRQPAYLSKAEAEQLLTKELAAREQDYLNVTSTLQSLAFDHFSKFGTPIDTQALIKKAREDRTNLTVAYERMIKPLVDEKSTKDMEERIKKERAEAAREALANANIPSAGALSSLAGQYVHPLDGLKAEKAPEFGWKAAAKAHTDAILSGKRISGDEGF